MQALRRQLVGVLSSGNVEVSVSFDEGTGGDDDGNDDEDDDAEVDAQEGAESVDGEQAMEVDAEGDGDGDDGDEGGENVVLVETARGDHDDSSSTSDSNSDLDVPDFREKLAPGDAYAITLWRSTVFKNFDELTGECALAVARWVERGLIKPECLDPEMLLCVVRCLDRGYRLFDEEDDLVTVFMAAVKLTETAECVHPLLERGALRSMIRGVQSSAHLLRDGVEDDSDWFDNDRLVRIYKAFKSLWQACQARSKDDATMKCIVDLVFAALGKWLRGVPLQDVWIGEDDILVFWVLIPLWPDYLDYLMSSESAEERGRFKEICNWVLWPNDPVLESRASYRLIGHLDQESGADFSLAFLLEEERFRWIVTPATKQRYLQYRVGQVADDRARARMATRSAENGVGTPAQAVANATTGDTYSESLPAPIASVFETGTATSADPNANVPMDASTNTDVRGNGQPDAEEEGLVLIVNRETPLQDLCKQLGVSGYRNEPDEPPNLLGGITVHFRTSDANGGTADEEGIDEGGPWREAIPLMFSELISPMHGLFEMREDDVRTVEPRWCAHELVPDYQAQFELCGILTGMALVYQAYTPAHFSRCFLTHLFGLPRTVAQDAPWLENQFTMMRRMSEGPDAEANMEALCLTFSVDDAATSRTVELKPGGADIAITPAQVAEYCQLRANWELHGKFEPLMVHVMKGLHSVIPPDALNAFARIVSAEELDIMLAGHGINIEDWRKHTEYYGCTETSAVVKWFWETVESFSAQEREDLWTFISGSKGVPPGGFGHLTNAAGEAIRFTIAKATASTNHLPVAHTCGYQLDLPNYETTEDLASKLRHAMSHRQGFGLA